MNNHKLKNRQKKLEFGNAAKFSIFRRIPPLVQWILIVILGIWIGYNFFFARTTWQRGNILLKTGNSNIAEREIKVATIPNSAATQAITLNQMLQIRTQTLQANSELLSEAYQPLANIFARVDNELPWWTDTAYYELGYSDNMPAGIPVEANSIINPFILLVPEFWSLTRWSNAGNVIDRNKLANLDHAAKELLPLNLYSPVAYKLTWNAKDKYAVIYYNISEFYERVAPIRHASSPMLPLTLGVTSYNALDMGFASVQVNPKHSSNIIAPEKTTTAPTRIFSFLAKSKICRNKEGCNHRLSSARAMSGFDNIQITELPAKITFSLWKNRPESIADASPNFLFTIVLE